MRRDISALGVGKLYFGLRDYGTATWEGGDAACDHVEKFNRNDGDRQDANGFAGSANKAGHAHMGAKQYRDLCGKCGARRIDSQIGLEETPEAYVAKLVDVFREVRRVLRSDATLWLNLGDSFRDKQLLGIPWRVAFALQADGWFLRMDCIWHKPSTMPESVTDRPTKAHEYIFLLSKSATYYYDADAIREPISQGSIERFGEVLPRTNVSPQGLKANGVKGESCMGSNPNGRNRRSVWTVTTKPYAGAHFATFPPDLITPCILAGTSARGQCAKCGSPWARVVEHTPGDAEAIDRPKRTGGMNSKTSTLSLSGNGSKEWAARGGKTITTGWAATCACGCTDVVPQTVLDPFCGSGTTLAVALKHGRHGIGLELNEDYITLAHKRIGQAQPLLLLEGA